MKRVLNDLFDENFIAVLAAEDGRFIYENPAARERFGCSFIGLQLDDIFLRADRDVSSLADGGSACFEAEICGHFLPVREVSIDGITVYHIGRADAVAGASAKILTALDVNVRSSLSVAMLGLHSVSRYMHEKSAPAERSGLLALCQSCYRMFRTAGDLGLLAALRTGRDTAQCENLNIFSVLSEFVEKTNTLLEHIGVSVTLQGDNTDVITALNRDRFERMYYCLIADCLSHENVSRIDIRFGANMQDIMILFSDDGKPVEFVNDPFMLDNFDDLTGKVPFELPLAEAIVSGFGGKIMISAGTGGNARTVSLPQRIVDKSVFHSANTEYSGGMDVALIELSPFIPSQFYEM